MHQHIDLNWLNIPLFRGVIGTLRRNFVISTPHCYTKIASQYVFYLHLSLPHDRRNTLHSVEGVILNLDA